jgi:fatty-acyl-CoA synthase
MGRLGDLARRGRLYADVARSTGLLGVVRPAAALRFAAQRIGRQKNPAWIVRLHALNTPDKLALVDGKIRLTWQELDDRINRVVGGLLALGVRPGDRVALVMRNCHQYLEVQWGVARLGATIVQIGYRLKPPEIAYILGNAEPRVLFHQPEDEATIRGALAERAVAHVIATGPAYEQFLQGGDGSDTRLEGAEPSVMIYTSGTTGRPKGAARSFKDGSSHEAALDFLRRVGIRHDDRQLVVCPLYHSAAPAFVAFGFALGSTVVLAEHFEPEATLALMERERITGAFLIPTMLGRLAAVPAEIRARYDLSALRWLASGAAPLPTETARRVESVFGRCLWNFYGATETGLVTLAGPGEHTERPGTIGRPLAGNDIRLLDEEGRDVGEGQVGELWARNSMLVSGYHRDAESTRKATRDGFFSVGDMARRDADGFYYLADRKIDMVISGGVNIYPLEIEQRLHQHPAILEAAVVGVPDQEWGESLKAFLVLRPGQTLTASDAQAFCRATLANFKVPKSVVFLDALPRNPTGKVLKRELRGP